MRFMKIHEDLKFEGQLLVQNGVPEGFWEQKCAQGESGSAPRAPKGAPRAPQERPRIGFLVIVGCFCDVRTASEDKNAQSLNLTIV